MIDLNSFFVDSSTTNVIPKYRIAYKTNNGIISGIKSKMLCGYVKNCSEIMESKIDTRIVTPVYLMIGGYVK